MWRNDNRGFYLLFRMLSIFERKEKKKAFQEEKGRFLIINLIYCKLLNLDDFQPIRYWFVLK
jgi:hypothetical protein